MDASNGQVIADGRQQDFSFTPASPGKYTVFFTVADTTDSTGTLSSTQVIYNSVDVVPRITSLPADTSLLEGDVFTGSGSFSDPGAESWTGTVDYGDGTVVPLVLSGKNFALNHTYGRTGHYTVTVKVFDGDPDHPGIGQFHVVAANVRPSVSLGPIATADSQGQFNSFGAFSDPGTVDSWTATVNYGDGGGNLPLALDQNARSFVLSHAYGRSGTYTVTASVTDHDGGTSRQSIAVRVGNVAPSPTITRAAGGAVPAHSPEGSAIALKATAHDPDTGDTFTYTWSVLKDGLPFATGNISSFTFTPDDNGTYDVSVVVADNHGGVGSASSEIVVDNVAPRASITGAPQVVRRGPPSPSAVRSPTPVRSTRRWAGPWSGP